MYCMFCNQSNKTVTKERATFHRVPVLSLLPPDRDDNLSPASPARCLLTYMVLHCEPKSRTRKPNPGAAQNARAPVGVVYIRTPPSPRTNREGNHLGTNCPHVRIGRVNRTGGYKKNARYPTLLLDPGYI